MTKTLFKLILLEALLILPSFTVRSQTTIQPKTRYYIGICDWMILKRQKLGEFALAKAIGADGVLLDMGSLGNNILFENKLRDSKEADIFHRTADSLRVEVPTVAMSGFFAQSFLQRNNYKDLIRDCLHTMSVFGSKVAFLPLGGCGKDWQKTDSLYDKLVHRLHVVGEMASKAHVIIGIRTRLDAKDNKKLLKRIHSGGIKIYYSFQDAVEKHRDICKELKELGSNAIVEILASNTDGVNLREDPQIDMQKIKGTLDQMGWSGWLIIERSRDIHRVHDVKYNYSRNVGFLKEIFQ
ncbi:MAG: sugar phosphate isomerase/epimerase [Prevotella sp.]|jgi:sugar phosphate isomerase/epimerase|nr:sugar phosphate isomerase/epimerase [Prevotella sp.]MCH4211521.1 sugar phosphate isomerase/epimerase [Prevotella sp.]MCH4240406.1 sugar phosphate isomerase/epimerase [Prevotella sp.]